jgi:carbamoyl-phosphate synthase large subunit
LNILISCSSNKTLLLEWIYKSIKKIKIKAKIFAGDSDKNVVSKYFCDYFWHMPILKDKNLGKILKFLKDKKIKIVFPTSDKELFFWSKHKSLFNKNKIFIMISELETIKSCIDKLKFFSILKNNENIPYTSSNLKDFNNKTKLVAKNRYGSGSKNIFINLSKKEIKLIKNKKNFIYQQYLKGKEFSVDCYFDNNHNLLSCLPRYRNKINNGESEITTAFKNYNNIKKALIKISKSFKFQGHVMFQGFLSGNKNFKIFECNPRLGGASYISSFYSSDSIVNFISENTSLKKNFLSKTNIIFDSKKMIIYKTAKFLNN